MSSKIILSVIGDHAGEEKISILNRKKQDCDDFGFCLWKYSSYNLSYNFIKEQPDKEIIECYFIESSNSADTKITNIAKEYSLDNMEWQQLPSNMSYVTGINTKKKFNTCLYITDIHIKNFDIKLDDYVNLRGNKKIERFNMGGSTVLVKKAQDDGVKVRKVVAVAQIQYPYIVLVR